jgi:hypothetical protein
MITIGAVLGAFAGAIRQKLLGTVVGAACGLWISFCLNVCCFSVGEPEVDYGLIFTLGFITVCATSGGVGATISQSVEKQWER